jgi:DNA-binding NarL/FixJ family response regulator
VIRIVIADDQQLVRDGFAAILSAEPDFEVVALAEDGEEVLDAVRRTAPDVVLMDIRMPRLDGIAATRQLAQTPDPPRVLVLTTFDLDEYVYDALRAGASGFLLKDAPRGRLAESIRTVAQGETLLDPAVTRRLVERFVKPAVRPGLVEALSPREAEVLQEIAGGKSNAEIAQTLFISEWTVKSHVVSILAKLGVRDRVQAVVVAYESGLVEPGSFRS